LLHFANKGAKMANARPIPAGMHTITPHLVIKGAAKAIEFYQKAFGATTVFPPHFTPDGKVMHALLQIGDSRLMLADSFEMPGAPRSPEALGGSPVILNLYVDNVDALWQRALDAGAKVVFPLQNQFWGDRYGQVRDPFGHEWALAQHVEDVSPAEMEERAKAAMAQMSQCK
jgi:PhnB protein